MSKQTRLWWALSGLLVGAAVAVYLRVQSVPTASPPPLPAPAPPAAPALTPAARQTPGEYVDETYGFRLTAAPGWYNETSGVLRKQYAGARGVLVKADSQHKVFLRIEALAPGPTRPDPAQFLASTVQALQSGGAIKVREQGRITLAGCPAVSVLTESRGLRAPNVVRHVWVFGPRAQLYLTCNDQTGLYAAHAPAFSAMLRGLSWLERK